MTLSADYINNTIANDVNIVSRNFDSGFPTKVIFNSGNKYYGFSLSDNPIKVEDSAVVLSKSIPSPISHAEHPHCSSISIGYEHVAYPSSPNAIFLPDNQYITISLTDRSHSENFEKITLSESSDTDAFIGARNAIRFAENIIQDTSLDASNQEVIFTRYCNNDGISHARDGMLFQVSETNDRDSFVDGDINVFGTDFIII